MSVKTRWRYGKRRTKRLIREVNKLRANPYIKIGYPKEHQEPKEQKEGEKKDVTVLDVAIYHEYGTKDMPERSFIRATRSSKYNSYKKLTNDSINQIIAGRTTVDKSLHKLGLIMVNDIKTFIRTRKVEPPSRRAKKEGGTTLWDTGQLINSLGYSISTNGKTARKGKKL